MQDLLELGLRQWNETQLLLRDHTSVRSRVMLVEHDTFTKNISDRFALT